MKAEPCAMYIGGIRVSCVRVRPKFDAPEGRNPAASVRPRIETPEAWTAMAWQAAKETGAPLLMARFPGPAPDGWTVMPRGYAKPAAAAPEALERLTEADRAAMRGLYGLYAGRHPGMLARENPEAWDARLSELPNPLGIFEGERLLLWLAVKDGELLELSAAPDALPRIPGALAEAGVTRAPTPLADSRAEWVDESVKLLLYRPFHIPGQRIETPAQLTRALIGAVQWD